MKLKSIKRLIASGLRWFRLCLNFLLPKPTYLDYPWENPTESQKRFEIVHPPRLKRKPRKKRLK